MTTDLRADYHEQLNDIQIGIARMSAGVTELVPRVTDILLQSDEAFPSIELCAVDAERCGYAGILGAYATLE